ncbi:MAG TPA: transporter substrate-binding domain-containing protein [Vicinamibacterales bacterium]|nr:transporter substrate-binding domain-containing protein [Vicinamibacterales bacterium]
MTRPGTIVAWIAALLITFTACSSKSPADPGPLVSIMISGHPEWPPIMYRSGAVIDGAGPALVKKIFDDLKLRTAFPYSGTWDEVQAKARTGEVDVLVAAYKTTERLTYMLYSDPYTTDPVALYVAKGKAFAFDTNWNVLIGKKGVAMVGDSYGQQFDDFAAANLQLVRATTAAQAFDLIASGQADYFLYALYAGDDFLKKNGQASKFETLPKFVADENFYITISKKSPFVIYLDDINKAIAKYKADGTIAALIAQYKNK